MSLMGSGKMLRMALASVSWSCAQHKLYTLRTQESWSLGLCWCCQDYLLSCSWSDCSSSCTRSCSWHWACSSACWSPYPGSWGENGEGRVERGRQKHMPWVHSTNFRIRLSPCFWELSEPGVTIYALPEIAKFMDLEGSG